MLRPCSIGARPRELAKQAGISLRTFQRIERLEVDNPPIRYLTNCAIVLGCELEDMVEPAWQEWKERGHS